MNTLGLEFRCRSFSDNSISGKSSNKLKSSKNIRRSFSASFEPAYNHRKKRRFKMDNQLPQKHYLGVLARAAWFAYLSPSETDQLYYHWGRDEGIIGFFIDVEISSPGSFTCHKGSEMAGRIL